MFVIAAIETCFAADSRTAAKSDEGKALRALAQEVAENEGLNTVTVTGDDLDTILRSRELVVSVGDGENGEVVCGVRGGRPVVAVVVDSERNDDGQIVARIAEFVLAPKAVIGGEE